MEHENIKELIENGNWMIRFDNDGKSYNGFKWEPIGEWTEAPDWNRKEQCGNGLHGQSPKGAGYCQRGSRMVLCETKGQQVVIGGDKVKVQYAMIVATNQDIPAVFIENLTQVGGSLDLDGYNHPG
jgi:hypothetical protein